MPEPVRFGIDGLSSPATTPHRNRPRTLATSPTRKQEKPGRPPAQQVSSPRTSPPDFFSSREKVAAKRSDEGRRLSNRSKAGSSGALTLTPALSRKGEGAKSPYLLEILRSQPSLAGSQQGLRYTLRPMANTRDLKSASKRSSPSVASPRRCR